MSNKSEEDSMLDEVEMVNVETEVEEGSVIDKNHVEWTSHLLDQLHDHELYEGNPTVVGLRRLVEVNVGTIVDSVSSIHQCPTRENPRATVSHTLTIQSNDMFTKTINGCVDVSEYNTPAPYNKHLVGSADTRAESKALRRALNMQILAHEELQSENNDAEVAEFRNASTLSDQQVLAVDQMCKRMDIDVQKYVKGMYKEVEYISDLSNSDGQILINGLSNIQRKKAGPDKDILGYKKSWKGIFYKGNL